MCDYIQFRDIIAEKMFNSSQGYKIGGPGLTVEIDESMFGKINFSLEEGRVT